MKNCLKRVILTVLSVCILMSLLSCCSDETMKLSAEAEKLVSTERIDFVDADGNAVFNIVRPDASNVGEGQTAAAIYKKYREIYNSSPKQMTDADNAADKREILIGETNREATAKVKEFLAANGTGRDSDYIVCSVGDSIVIYGNCSAAVAEAGEYFLNNFMKKAQKNGIYHMHNGNESQMTVCNISELSRFTVVRPIYNVSYLTQCETDKLCKLLYKKTGYDVKVTHDREAKHPEDPTERGGILETTPAVEYEIIIGDAEREGVRDIAVSYAYEIRIEGTKIYLNGGSPHATAMAVSEFIKIAENNDVIDESMSVLDGNYNNALRNYDKATYYRPTWGDDFNGTDINTEKWRVMWDAKGSTAVDGKPCYRGSSVLKNNYVKDGCLVIEAAKTEDAYYGGMLQTDKTMEFLYGFLEISDIHPCGSGFWTALWMVSKSSRYNKDMWVSETDVDEAFGDGESIVGNLWAWPTGYGRNKLGLHSGRADTVKSFGTYTSQDARGLWMDFHTYGFEWVDNKTIRFTVDGYVWRDVEIEEEELQTAYSQYMYLKLSMATGFNEMGVVTNDEWQWENSNKFIVDWVYLYQLDGHGLMKY